MKVVDDKAVKFYCVHAYWQGEDGFVGVNVEDKMAA